jgi:hypothetical protein
VRINHFETSRLINESTGTRHSDQQQLRIHNTLWHPKNDCSSPLPVAPFCNKLQQVATSCNKLQQALTGCTMLQQFCNRLFQATSSVVEPQCCHTNLHQATSGRNRLQQVATNCTKLHRFHRTATT